MNGIKVILGVVLIGFGVQAFGYGLAVSTHPLETGKRLIHAEATGVLTEGKGFGIQARYVHKVHESFVLDGGLGIGGGERPNRIFAGADYLILPDVNKQPRVSIRGHFENAKEFESRRNILGLTPTVSKGFNIYGKEIFPFLGLPLELNLNPEGESVTVQEFVGTQNVAGVITPITRNKVISNEKSYEIVARVSLGATAQVPIEGYEMLVANLQTDINLKDGYTGFFLGVGYPF